MVGHLSPHFHSESKGCELYKANVPMALEPGEFYPGKYCKTHGILVCRCGYEVGWHGGKYSWPVERKYARWVAPKGQTI